MRLFHRHIWKVVKFNKMVWTTTGNPADHKVWYQCQDPSCQDVKVKRRDAELTREEVERLYPNP